MARNTAFSRRRWSSESVQELGELLPSESHDVHVLAVDDSLIDRKVIERLLKITSCKGTHNLFIFRVCVHFTRLAVEL